MILVLHARLTTFWVVIMRHVEPGAERETRTWVRDGERDRRNTHNVIIMLLNGCSVCASSFLHTYIHTCIPSTIMAYKQVRITSSSPLIRQRPPSHILKGLNAEGKAGAVTPTPLYIDFTA